MKKSRQFLKTNRVRLLGNPSGLKEFAFLRTIRVYPFFHPSFPLFVSVALSVTCYKSTEIVPVRARSWRGGGTRPILGRLPFEERKRCLRLRLELGIWNLELYFNILSNVGSIASAQS